MSKSGVISVAVSGPKKRVARITFDRMVFAFYLVWSVPVLQFTLNPSFIPSAWPVWIAISFTVLFAFVDNRFLSLGIPFAGLFSPLAKSTLVMGLLPSELYIGVCLLFILIQILLKGRIKIKPVHGFLIALLLTVLISFVFSIDQQSGIKPLINWAALVVVFLMISFHARTSAFAVTYLKSLVVISVFTSLIMVSAYANGLTLADFLDGEEVRIVFENLQNFYRGSFWYINISFVLGSGFMTAMIYLFYIKTKASFTFVVGAMIIILLAIIVAFNKTAMLAISISTFVLLMVNIRKVGAKSLIFTIFSIGSVVGSLLYILPSIAKQPEYLGLTANSLLVRLEVYESTFNVMLSDPLRFFVGYGPDATIRMTNDIVNSAKSNSTGLEGAIDSAYMTYLFEYGIIFLTLLAMYVFYGLRQLLHDMRKFRNNSFIPTALFAIQVYICVAALTQVMSTSKVAWVVVSFFALGGSWQSGMTDLYKKPI
jgi:hypothetical protein